MSEPEPNKNKMQLEPIDETHSRLILAGDWLIESGLQHVDDIIQQFRQQSVDSLLVDGDQVERWDSSLIVFLLALKNQLAVLGTKLDLQRCPEGALRLIALAEAVPGQDAPVAAGPQTGRIENLGRSVQLAFSSLSELTEFLGEALLSIRRGVTGKAIYRQPDLIGFLHETGPAALGIVTLISVLIGMILAFVGAVQLQKFGASIYVANLVGLAMSREMAAMMTAIIMAGRTGAAYAAQLGSMQVNEEVDALKTMGVSPFDYLVLPRMLALVLMMPLLTVYANLMGLLGGGLVSTSMLDVTWSMYYEQVTTSVPLRHFAIGLFKSVIFAVLVALSGCVMGMRCGRSATAVGQATTAAVVLGIVLIIVSDSIVTICTTVIGI